MQDAVCDDDGCVELPDVLALQLLNTSGWSDPVKRAPRKAATRPSAPVAPQPAPEVEESPEAPEEGSEEGEEGEEVPAYAEWSYHDLVTEAKARMEDPDFQPPDSRSKDDIVKALEADDAKDE